METRKVATSKIPADVAGAKTAAQAQQAALAASAAKPSAAQASATKSHASAMSAGINVAVSPKARELADARAKAFEIAKATPDIRENRVAQIKQQIGAGTYQVDPGKIADGIAREALLEYLAESK